MTEVSPAKRPESPAVSPRVAGAPTFGRRAFKRAIVVLALLTGSVAAGRFAYDYWVYGRFLESTDDAYVQADYTSVAPKVSGYISQIFVADNQQVRAGQVLARIDDRDFLTALNLARADVAAAEASVQNYDSQLDLQQAEIAQAVATVASTHAQLTFAEEDAVRYRKLVPSGAGTVQRSEQAQAARDALKAQLLHDRASVTAAERKVEVLKTARAQAEAQVQCARAAQHQAELNLDYTIITAPLDGTVGDRLLRVGQFVSAGTQLMAVVPLHAAYVVANFKETQLLNVRAGQPVVIDVDGLPDARISGHVDSISPASGLEFALLPPDNATGNFTKIVQRIPVKIVLDDTADAGVLRAGMSVEPTIDTANRAVERNTAAASQRRSG